MKNKLNFLLIALILITKTTSAQNWTQIGSDIVGEDFMGFGYSVSLSEDGRVVAIGAPSDYSRAGYVRVYQNLNDSWTQIGSDINGDNYGDASGFTVSLSGDGSTVAIGTPYNHINSNDTGYLRIYQNLNDSWTQIGSDIVREEISDYSGYSISLSSDGSTVAIGRSKSVPDIDPPAGSNPRKSSHVMVYQNINGSWTQIGSDIGVGLSYSGISVSLSSSGGTLAIGIEGHVGIYENINSTWTQIGSDIDGEATIGFGSSVSLSSNGSIVAIGCTGGRSSWFDTGTIRVYQYLNDSWTQIGSDIIGEENTPNKRTAKPPEIIGYSVSLSSDGDVLAVGCPWSDTVGNVKVYLNINGSWTQIGADIDGEDYLEDAGYTVSLSGDGSIVAIGSPGVREEGPFDLPYSGIVRVYRLGTGASTETIEAPKIYISPNPVSDILTVNGITKPLEFQIIDLTGKEILSGEMSNNTVDVSTLKVGIYFLIIDNQSIKFVKELN